MSDSDIQRLSEHVSTFDLGPNALSLDDTELLSIKCDVISNSSVSAKKFDQLICLYRYNITNVLFM